MVHTSSKEEVVFRSVVVGDAGQTQVSVVEQSSVKYDAINTCKLCVNSLTVFQASSPANIKFTAFSVAKMLNFSLWHASETRRNKPKAEMITWRAWSPRIRGHWGPDMKVVKAVNAEQICNLWSWKVQKPQTPWCPWGTCRRCESRGCQHLLCCDTCLSAKNHRS